MDGQRWRIGELARATGLTVRTLRHYDEVGLLVPSGRTAAGYRLYCDGDVRRLYRIRALRELGLGLGEVGACLDGGDLSEAVRHHLERLDSELEQRRVLRGRLVRILDGLDRRAEPPTQDLFDVIEVMTMFEQYYSQKQLAALGERRRRLGDEAIRKAEEEWAEVIAAVEAERERGADPAGPRMQELAGRWQELVELFTGGDAGIRDSLQRMYEEEGPERASRGAVDPELMAYVGAAVAARARKP